MWVSNSLRGRKRDKGNALFYLDFLKRLMTAMALLTLASGYSLGQVIATSRH